MFQGLGQDLANHKFYPQMAGGLKSLKFAFWLSNYHPRFQISSQPTKIVSCWKVCGYPVKLEIPESQILDKDSSFL